MHNPKKRIGIRAVMEVAGVLDKPLSASTIAFSIAPRLNAAGRLGSAATAVELLLTNDESRARELALLLDTENKERQQTERQIFDEALELIAKKIRISKRKSYRACTGKLASRCNRNCCVKVM